MKSLLGYCVETAVFLLMWSVVLAGAAGCDKAQGGNTADENIVPATSSIGCSDASVWRAKRLQSGKIAIVTSDELQLWEASNPKAPTVRMRLPDPGAVGKVSPISDVLAAWEDYPNERKRVVKIFELATGNTRHVFPLRKPWEVEAIASSYRGNLLVWVEQQHPMRGNTFRMRVADARSGKIIADVVAPLVYPRTQTITALTIAPDEQTVAFGSWDGGAAVGVVDVKNKKVLWHKKQEPLGGTWKIAYCPDSKSFFTTDDCGQLTRYETSTGKVLSTFVVKLPALTPWGEQARESLLAVDVSPDGKYVAAGTDYTRQVIIWEIASGKRVKTLKVSKYPVGVLFFSEDGKGIWAAGTCDKKLRLFKFK